VYRANRPISLVFSGGFSEMVVWGDGVEAFFWFGVFVRGDDFTKKNDMVTGISLGDECAFEVCDGI